jgi:dTDP-4-dehydrorhamnose 3,5-epimerase
MRRDHHQEGHLPDGVRILPLVPHADERGELVELYRQSWGGPRPVQWNCVRSEARTLRGVHVHIAHWDYLVVTSGSCLFGLYDARGGSPTEGHRAFVQADGARPFALVLPPGVAHGFYFAVPSVHVYGVTHYWDLRDELGCRFDDPDLGLDWPTRDVVLSPRDQRLPPLRDVLPKIPRWRPARHAAAGGARDAEPPTMQAS